MVNGNGIVPVDPCAQTEAVALAQAGPFEGADLTDVEVIPERVVQVLSHTALARTIAA